MELQDEEWRDASGYEGIYRVSSAGNVMSVEHSLIDSAGRKRHFPARLLTPTIGKDPRYGYAHLSLTKDGIAKRVWLHRLVAETFIPNPNNLPQVNHKDGNKSNNHIDNLEWCTVAHNLKHAVETGLRPDTRWRPGDTCVKVEVVTPDGEKIVFGSVDSASKFIGYKYANHFSRDLHKNHGICISGFTARRLDNFISKYDK